MAHKLPISDLLIKVKVSCSVKQITPLIAEPLSFTIWFWRLLTKL